ncbi:hypothetical protein [Legionella sainthelensi]|uniref:hypothetical protein n=1 Tax=Legionella sainthelensi TaxID=28087 RepID=UPI0015F2DC56|nr:hypothetical protein [Legionella sainthelensi]
MVDKYEQQWYVARNSPLFILSHTTAMAPYAIIKKFEANTAASIIDYIIDNFVSA